MVGRRSVARWSALWRRFVGGEPSGSGGQARPADADGSAPSDNDDADLGSDFGHLIVREARDEADMAAIRAIRRIVFHDEQGFIGETVTDSDDARSAQVLALIPLRSDDGDLGPDLALRIGDQLAIGCGRLTPASRRTGEASITWVATLPGYRGNGAGAAVMAVMLAIARDQGAPAVLLSSQGHAVAFYRRLGFVTVGAPFEIRGMPHQLMSLRLESSDGT